MGGEILGASFLLTFAIEQHEVIYRNGSKLHTTFINSFILPGLIPGVVNVIPLQRMACCPAIGRAVGGQSLAVS